MAITFWQQLLGRLRSLGRIHPIRRRRRSHHGWAANRLELLELRVLPTPHLLSIDRAGPAAATNATSVSYTVSFDQAVTGVDAADFTVARTGTVGSTLSQVTPVSGSAGAVYSAAVSGITGSGTLGLNFTDDGSIRDLSSNLLGTASFTGQAYTIDPTVLSVSPHVVSINRTTPSTPTTSATSVSYTVTFSEAVTGVDATDFTRISGGSVATATPVTVTPVSTSVYTVTIGGISGTGTLGLNLVDNGSIRDADGNPLVQTNASAAFHAQTLFAAGSGPFSVAVGDVNGDGRLDLITANGGNSNVSVLLGKGDGTFQTQAAFATGSNPFSVAVGDVNGDGRPDLLIANLNSNNVGVLLGNGNGTFQAQATFAAGVNPDSVAVGDVNGDGRPDLLVANFGNNNVSVLLGNGDGTFQTQSTFAARGNPVSVAVGDVNGDSRPDLVVANYFSNNVSVLLGNGNGTFQAQATFAAGTHPRSVTVGDVNGDGRPDLLVANQDDNDVSVLLGNGNGTFQAQATFATGSVPRSVAVGDLNGDGRPDLLVANQHDNDVSVLLGKGNGTFQAQATFAAGSGPIFAAVGDVNGDGRPDLLVANVVSNNVSVLLGTGNGSFTGQVYTIVASASQGPVITVTAATPTTVKLSWTAVPGASKYWVDWFDGTSIHYVGPNNGNFSASQTSVQVTGMKPGAFEKFLVYAINGTTNPGSGWVGLTMPPLAAPVITVTAASPTAVNLSWTAVPGATSYWVDWFDGTSIHYVGPNKGYFSASQTSVQVTGMKPGAFEKFFVYAISGSASAGSGWVGLTMPPLAAPVITVTAASPTVVNLSWTAVPGATSYWVDWFDGTSIHYVGPNKGYFSASQTSVQVTGMKPGAFEKFFVYAISGSANTGSGWTLLTMPLG